MIDRETVIEMAEKHCFCTSDQHKEFLHDGLVAFVNEITQAVAQKAVEAERAKHPRIEPITDAEIATLESVPIFNGVDPDQLRWIVRRTEYEYGINDATGLAEAGVVRIRARGTGDKIQEKPKETRMDTSNQVVNDEQIDEIFIAASKIVI